MITEKFVMLGERNDQERLYFADINLCESERRLSDWWYLANDAADDIKVQISVRQELGDIDGSEWHRKAIKALTSYRQAQHRIKKRLLAIGGDLLERVA